MKTSLSRLIQFLAIVALLAFGVSPKARAHDFPTQSVAQSHCTLNCFGTAEDSPAARLAVSAPEPRAAGGRVSASLASFHSSLLPSYQGLVAHTARPAAVLAQWLEQSSMVWSELQAVQPLRHVLSPDAGLPPSPAHSLSSLRFSAAQQSWCVSRPDPGRAPRPAAKTAKQPIAAHKSLLVASPLAGQAPRPRILAKNTATAPAKITPLAMPQHFSAGYLPADLGSCDWQGNQPLLHSTRTAPHRGSQVPAELAATAALGQNVGDAGPASSHRAVAQASTGSWLWLKSVQPSTMDRWVKQSLSTTSHHLRWQASKQLENAGQAMLQISRYLAPVAESKMAHADSDALR